MIKRFALIILVLILVSTSIFAINTPALHTEGKFFKDPNGNTVILRGLSMVSLWNMGTRNGPRYSFYTTQYPVETPENDAKALIDLATDPTKHGIGWYSRVIRLPIYPTMQDADPGWAVCTETQRNTYKALLQTIVDYCVTKGVYVIIDWHYIADYGDKTATTQAFWDYIAPTYKNYTNVIFELYNEPIAYANGGQPGADKTWATWKNWAQPQVDRIRNTHGAQNIILVGAPNWSQLLADADANPITGGNIGYVCHLYPYHWEGKDQTPEAPDGDLSRFLGSTINNKPVFFTEWGFKNGAAIPCDAENEDGYASGMKTYLNTTGASWTGWCFDPYWEPVMFNNWDFIGLLGGSLPTTGGAQGKFIQDFLYEKRDSDLPGGGGSSTPDPTPAPTADPTAVPTAAPTPDPGTAAPTAVPTATPATTADPTAAPTADPTPDPATPAPTADPTPDPTADPGSCTAITPNWTKDGSVSACFTTTSTTWSYVNMWNGMSATINGQLVTGWASRTSLPGPVGGVYTIQLNCTTGYGHFEIMN